VYQRLLALVFISSVAKRQMSVYIDTQSKCCGQYYFVWFLPFSTCWFMNIAVDKFTDGCFVHLFIRRPNFFVVCVYLFFNVSICTLIV